MKPITKTWFSYGMNGFTKLFVTITSKQLMGRDGWSDYHFHRYRLMASELGYIKCERDFLLFELWKDRWS